MLAHCTELDAGVQYDQYGAAYGCHDVWQSVCTLLCRGFAGTLALAGLRLRRQLSGQVYHIRLCM